MAVTTDAFTATDLAGFIPEKWPGLVQEEMFAKAVAAKFFLDLSSVVTTEGDTVHVPDVFTNAFTLQTQTTQGAEVTTAGPAQTDTTLAINTHKYIAFIVGDKDIVQMMNNYRYNDVYIRKSAGTLRVGLESALYGLWSDLSTYTVGDTATVLTDAEIRVGINSLEGADFDTLSGEVAFHFHPYTFYVQLGSVAKYYDQSQRGPLSAAGFVQNGMMGQPASRVGQRGWLYGIPALISSSVVSGLQTYRNLLAHKDAFCFATQYLPTPGVMTEEEGRVRAQSNYELRNLGYLTVVDMIYGVKTLREASAVLLNGSSAFIGS